MFKAHSTCKTMILVNFLLILLTLAMMTSCVTTSSYSANDDFTNRIMAENSQLKKLLPLTERENDVLKQENLQYNIKVRQLNAKVEELSSELEKLEEKYKKDIALSEEHILNLQTEYEALATESVQMIDEINQRNEELELKRNKEIKTLQSQITEQKTSYEKDMALSQKRIKTLQAEYETFQTESAQKIEDINQRYVTLEQEKNKKIKELNDKITLQQTSFDQEKDHLIKENSAKENNLTIKINELHNAVQTRETQINSLERANKDISIKLETVAQKLEQVTSERDQIKKDLKTKKEAKIEPYEKYKSALYQQIRSETMQLTAQRQPQKK